MYRIASVNDLSGLGNCSLMASIPIMSAMGVQVSPLPTAILSAQTGFKNFSFFDFTPEMEEYINNWQKINVKFHGIATGFLGSEDQIDIVRRFCEEHRESLIVVDPVMGSNGVICKTYTEAMCYKMKELIKLAQVVTPNITESSIITGSHMHYSGDDILKFYKEEAEKISEIGPEHVIITGIIKEGNILNLAFNRKEKEFYLSSVPYNEKSYSGTGDIFTSIVSVAMVKGKGLEESVKTATSFIYKVVEYTESFSDHGNEGIKFQPFLGELCGL
ncbi:pyridoxine kinase [Hathewaya proteolytica DSM 3090]|uniref:Pyridoxine kinase n=1 Tax=Hathewaya proteolytica DSM 3090 TaxID=1121331 RepID=A0A1M6KYU6_9CLOT|nr:pyridoxamine kinase [Hathewaya proteolytica]SHJ64012.1 pyridoxine kinase [Hathewaya proteolytica DSM 3090]